MPSSVVRHCLSLPSPKCRQTPHPDRFMETHPVQKRVYPLILLLACSVPCHAQITARQTVILQQAGFPTIASDPVSRQALSAALPDAAFASIAELRSSEVLARASLLV